VPSRLPSAALLVLVFALLAAGCGSDSKPEGFSEGRSIYGDKCSVCHGAAGDGGTGPALATVVENWPECSAQVEWISLGSDGWQAEHGGVYGTAEKPVAGGMPAHGTSLTLRELELVAAFVRAQYGGLDPEIALQQCQTG